MEGSIELMMEKDLVSQAETCREPFNNISDWSLNTFRDVYKSHEITKADIWEYIYGVMHASDWRTKFGNELKKNLPRIPLAPGGYESFIAFQEAGRELFELHTEFELAPEADIQVQVDDEGHYRIEDRMRWRDESKSTLEINKTCRLVGIPESAHLYKISGRSPLEWAVDSLYHKVDRRSGIVDDPNGWYVWRDDPFELVRHLRRLAFIGLRTTTIVNALPPSLPTERI